VKRFRAPNEHEAGERSWEIVRAAYRARGPVTWPRRHARPLVAGALVAAAVAAVLSPPGRSVVHSLRKAVGVENAQTELFSLPARGRLLVSGRGGTWIVSQDGSRRRIGVYNDATWSPHALFVVATHKDELVAVDPRGDVRWTLPRRSPRFPTWTGTRTDTRIAYIAGKKLHEQLHVVAGDGTGDHTLGEAVPAAPAWRPGPGRVLAYMAGPRLHGPRLVVFDVDTGQTLLRLRPPVSTWRLAWSSDGRLLLAVGARSLRVYDANGKVVLAREPSGGNHYVDGGFVPGTHRVLALREYSFQSAVLSPDTGKVVFRGSGTFGELGFSPDGRWVLVSWPTANQWVFLRTGHPRRIVGVSRISSQFGGFPRLKGWCCGR
jgi:hypothetical protein